MIESSQQEQKEKQSNEVIAIESLKKYYSAESGLAGAIFSRSRNYIRAVDDVTFSIEKGRILTLVGESGCGKTTVARCVIRLTEPTSGRILFNGEDIFRSKGRASNAIRSKMQMIFQDPYGSLDSHNQIHSSVAEPLDSNPLFSNMKKDEKSDLIAKALDVVGLKPSEDYASKYPGDLSGGQLQRVSIARAIVSNPEFIVADEPTSMLDVSVRSKILNLLLELREKFNLTYLMITHDLAMARHISDQIAIMYLGKIVERGNSEDIVREPLHPYTQMLLQASPTLAEGSEEKHAQATSLSNEVPNAINIPNGCRFNTRCPYAKENCFTLEPPLVEIKKDHYVACHLLTA